MTYKIMLMQLYLVGMHVDGCCMHFVFSGHSQKPHTAV